LAKSFKIRIYKVYKLDKGPNAITEIIENSQEDAKANSGSISKITNFIDNVAPIIEQLTIKHIKLWI
jgi:hypothetical protein